MSDQRLGQVANDANSAAHAAHRAITSLPITHETKDSKMLNLMKNFTIVFASIFVSVIIIQYVLTLYIMAAGIINIGFMRYAHGIGLVAICAIIAETLIILPVAGTALYGIKLARTLVSQEKDYEKAEAENDELLRTGQMLRKFPELRKPS